MLPEGFEWRPFVKGPALYLAGRQLAICSLLDNGRVRVDFCLVRRSEFFDQLKDAEHYCVAWARKWERRIREEAGRNIVRGW